VQRKEQLQVTEPVSEDQFKHLMYTKHQGHFDHFYRLLWLAEESLGKYRGLSGDAYQATLQLIFPRAYKSFDSIRRLCEVASCEDAAVILRCLLNLMVVTRWISLKPQARARRYLAWYWVEMNREVAQFQGEVPPAWLADIQKHYEEVRRLFERKQKRGRTVLVKQWYQPEAQTIVDLFKEVGLEKHYEDAYRALSGVEHSDALAYFAMMAGAERTENERKLGVQDDRFVPHYLRNGFQYFGDIFRTCNRTIALVDATQLDEMVKEGMEFYAANMRAHGVSP
jgi:Family of unknown function (DUF5677)